MTEMSRLTRYQALFLTMAVVGQLFLAGDWYGFAAVIPFASKSLSLSAGQAGFAQGAFAITYALGMLVWSPLGRTLSARSLMSIGLIGCGATMALLSLVQTPTQLIAVRLLIGFFDAAVWVGTMKLVVSWFPRKAQGTTMGVLLAAFSLAITMDFAIGIPLTAAYGWRFFFQILGSATIVAGLASALLVKANPAAVGIDAPFETAAEHGGSGDLGAVFRSRWIYIAILAIFGDTFGIGATATWVIPAWIDVQKMQIESAATIGSIMGLSQVGFLIVGGWLSDKFSRSAVILMGSALCVATALGFLVTVKMQMAWSSLLLVAALSGAVVTSGGAIFSLLADKMGPKLAATAIGFAELGGISATFVAPALMGVLVERYHSFIQAFWLLVIVEVVISAGLFVVLARRAPAEHSVLSEV